MLLKNEKRIKRCIAALLVITMITPLVSSLSSTKIARATEGYTNWTYTTAGLSDGNASADAGYLAYKQEETFELAGTKFSGYVDFNGLAEGLVAGTYDPSRLIFGHTNTAGYWGDKAIWFGVSKLAAQEGYGYLHCGVPGAGEWSIRDYAIPSGEEMFLQVAFDYIDSDNDGGEDDLQLHIWINGTPATKVVEAWGNWDNVTGDDICLPDYKDDEDPVSASVGFGVKSSMNGTVTYRSVHPVTISGIENNKTYCSGVELSVATDAADGLYEKDLESVTVNGTVIGFIEGKYTIPAGTGETEVIVTDKMGNTQVYNVIVSAKHSYGKDGQCTVCGAIKLKEYTTWTYATAGLTDGNASTDAGYLAYNQEETFELAGTKFSGYVDFNGLADGYVVSTYDPSRLIFGHTNAAGYWGDKAIWFGVSKLAAQEGYGYLHCGVPGAGEWSIRDYAIQSGEEIFLQVAFDYIDSDNDGDEDDLQLHVWINGTQATKVVEAWGNWNNVTGDDICIPNYKNDEDPVSASVGFGVKTSMNGTVTYRSVHPITISGIENNKTYCSGVELSVATDATDGLYEKDLESVTLNGIAVSFTEGTYTIPAGKGSITVVATNKIGESKTYNITVNADHTYGEGNLCTECGAIKPREYTTWTYATAGAKDGTVATDTGYVTYIQEEKIELAGTKFSGYVDFNGLAEGFVVNTYDPSRLIFGYTDAQGLWDTRKMVWFGVSKLASSTDESGYLHCGVAGYEWYVKDQLIQSGEEILLQVAFDYIDSDNDTYEDDLQLHVWINGTPAAQVVEAWGNWDNVTGDDICILDYKDVENPVYASVLFGVKTSMNGTLSYRSAEIRVAENELTYDLASGDYVVLGKGTIQVNGNPVSPGHKLQSTGDYLIEWLYNGVTYKNTIHLIDSSNNSVQIPALTYDALGGDEVMPIYGHYLPGWKTYKDEDDTTTPIYFTTDEYYELVREAGINTILWTETNAANNQDDVLEQLRLAEKYNMGMYVWDTTFETLAESQYWERLADYSQYKSFLGINSIDEPTTEAYGRTDDTRGNTYIAPAKIFNQYTNLIGYVNAFPMLTKLVLNEQDKIDVKTNPERLYEIYADYLKEGIIDVGGKIISYDRYPVEYDWTEEPDGEGTKYVLVNSPEFYKNLSIMRNTAANNNLPFKVAISSGDYCNAEDKYRQMTREDLLWSVNVSLAYGAKGLSYYTMVEVDNSTEVGKDGAAEHGLIDCRGNKTKWYGYVQEANKHIAAIDHVLMKSLHQGVIAVGEDSYVSNCVSGLEECIPSKKYGDYNLERVTTSGTEYGALMGVFKYYPNADSTTDYYNAYYIVNSDTSSKQTISLEFDTASTYSVILGTKASYVGTASTECNITIPAGEGVLIVLGKDLTKAAREPQVIWYEDIKPYRVNEATGNVQRRAPEIQTKASEEYVFAGWFTDEACTIPLAENVTEGSAYARFVDADIMSVKVQLRQDYSTLRFVSTVDRLDYTSAGFDIRCGAKGITREFKEVYRELYGIQNETVMEYKPTECSEFSTRFYAYNIYEIPEEMQTAPFIVNSYWITRDGTKVYGDSVSYSVEEIIKIMNEMGEGGV